MKEIKLIRRKFFKYKMPLKNVYFYIGENENVTFDEQVTVFEYIKNESIYEKKSKFKTLIKILKTC